MTPKKPIHLPDPVTGTSGNVSVQAWVNKDGWVDGKPPAGLPPRFFITATLQRSHGQPALELEITGKDGLDEGDLQHLAAGIGLVAGQITKSKAK